VRIATAIVCDVLRGLHAIHEAESPSGEKLGLVHRDVAPDNVRQSSRARSSPG